MIFQLSYKIILEKEWDISAFMKDFWDNVTNQEVSSLNKTGILVPQVYIRIEWEYILCVYYQFLLYSRSSINVSYHFYQFFTTKKVQLLRQIIHIFGLWGTKWLYRKVYLPSDYEIAFYSKSISIWILLLWLLPILFYFHFYHLH